MNGIGPSPSQDRYLARNQIRGVVHLRLSVLIFPARRARVGTGEIMNQSNCASTASVISKTTVRNRFVTPPRTTLQRRHDVSPASVIDHGQLRIRSVEQARSDTSLNSDLFDIARATVLVHEACSRPSVYPGANSIVSCGIGELTQNRTGSSDSVHIAGRDEATGRSVTSRFKQSVHHRPGWLQLTPFDPTYGRRGDSGHSGQICL